MASLKVDCFRPLTRNAQAPSIPPMVASMLGRSEEVAAAVLRLCSPAASFVIGVALPVYGGFTAH